MSKFYLPDGSSQHRRFDYAPDAEAYADQLGAVAYTFGGDLLQRWPGYGWVSVR